MIEAHVQSRLQQAVRAAQQAGTLPATLVCPPIALEQPKLAAHGDFATNLALQLAKPARLAPRLIAQAIVAQLPADPLIIEVSIAGAGFINFRIAPTWYLQQLADILHAGRRFGQVDVGQGKKCLVEFVSANPTGPLHVGHGRGAIYGDILGNLLQAAGYVVTKEYYVNDSGVQIETLGRSVWLRLRELRGEAIEFPAECYQGEYIVEIARSVLERQMAHLDGRPEAEQFAWCGQFAGAMILEEITHDLANCGVVLDHYYRESQLHSSNAVTQAIEHLRAQGHLYEQDGALWFRTTALGDDKDRVVRKSDGQLTYFTADIAYHRDKLQRGYERLVDIFGADHGGYVARMKAAMVGLGYAPEALDCVLMQLVNLVRDGQKVSMSTRRAEYETLADLTKEVGRDVVRYFYLMRSHQAQLDFDLHLATANTMENPVYYIQYAHARICSLFAKLADAGECWDPQAPIAVASLHLPEEAQLARLIGEYPQIIALAARELEPHRVAFYLLEVARKFQAYYSMGKRDARYRVLDQDPVARQAKLSLLKAIQIVLQNALNLLGLSIPERMD